MLDATTPLTSALRATLSDALTPNDDDAPSSVIDAGTPIYVALLDATDDGAPLGDLIDVVHMFDLDA